MKKLVTLLAAVIAFALLPQYAMSAPLAAPAADAEKTAAVKTMLEAMDVRAVMADSIANLELNLPSLMRSQAVAAIQFDAALSDEQKREAVARIDKMLPEASNEVARVFKDPALVDEIVAKLAPLYAEHFSTAEIRELTAFYRTPVGRKLMAKMPKLSAESTMLGQMIILQRMQGLMQEFAQRAHKH